jgi:hypothetical protein
VKRTLLILEIDPGPKLSREEAQEIAINLWEILENPKTKVRRGEFSRDADQENRAYKLVKL